MTTVKGTSGMLTATQLQKNQQAMLLSLTKIASGSRITRAADDGSGLTIADTLGSQARGMGQSIQNINDAISITQIADGTLGQATEVVQSIRVKALQAGNASQSADSRQALQADIQKSLKQLDAMAQTTTYNGQQLLNGGFTNKAFQGGAQSGDSTSLSLGSIQSGQLGDQKLGSMASIDATSEQGAATAVGIADAALKQIDTMRSGVGAYQNQLSATVSNLATSRINTLAAESAVRDLDLAEESANFAAMESLNKVQVFAATQANASKKNVINLLQGSF